jgi:hypothetical protein
VRTLPAVVAIIAAASGCSSFASDPPVNGRPAGVSLCYSQTADEASAVTGYWTTMLAADYAGRPAALAALAAAAQQLPSEEEIALVDGLANLWRLAEPTDAEAQDSAGFIEAALNAKTEVQRAFDLCPTDYRIPAWLGPILVNMGRQLNDQSTIDMGLSVLQVGIDHYPSFVLFSKLLVYAARPASDPDFQQALQAVDADIGACGDLATTKDPACRNNPHSIHNVEGAALFLGDAYAKAGRRADALSVYQGAQTSADYAGWPFRAVLDDRVATIDARLAAYAAGMEPEAAWTSRSQCSYCHQK